MTASQSAKIATSHAAVRLDYNSNNFKIILTCYFNCFKQECGKLPTLHHHYVKCGYHHSYAHVYCNNLICESCAKPENSLSQWCHLCTSSCYENEQYLKGGKHLFCYSHLSDYCSPSNLEEAMEQLLEQHQQQQNKYSITTHEGKIILPLQEIINNYKTGNNNQQQNQQLVEEMITNILARKERDRELHYIFDEMFYPYPEEEDDEQFNKEDYLAKQQLAFNEYKQRLKVSRGYHDCYACGKTICLNHGVRCKFNHGIVCITCIQAVDKDYGHSAYDKEYSPDMICTKCAVQQKINGTAKN